MMRRSGVAVRSMTISGMAAADPLSVTSLPLLLQRPVRKATISAGAATLCSERHVLRSGAMPCAGGRSAWCTSRHDLGRSERTPRTGSLMQPRRPVSDAAWQGPRPGLHDGSEFRLRMLMQRSASPFAINSAVRDRWLRALISPLGGPDRCRLFTGSGARSAVLALYADLPFMYLIELVADGLCGRSRIQRRRWRRRAFACWAPPGWPGLAPRAAGATGFVAKR
jgi:hypothetical protein